MAGEQLTRVPPGTAPKNGAEFLSGSPRALKSLERMVRRRGHNSNLLPPLHVHLASAFRLA
jgi:hypothetical protein